MFTDQFILSMAAAPATPQAKPFIEKLYDLDFLMNVLMAIALALGGYLLLLGLVRLLQRKLSQKLSPQHIMLITKGLTWGGVFLLLLSTLQQLGFEIGSILGAAGIVGVAIGFAAQTSMSNLISGIFLIFERPFQIGDTITIGDQTGMVLSIDLLSVKIRQFDNRLIRIPNEQILKQQVVNVTHFPIRRIDINIGIAYKEDLDKAKRLLQQVADKHPKALADPEPVIVFTGFNASSQDLLLGVWVEKTDFLEVRNDLTRNIKLAFDENKIEIPFPHMTLYAGEETKPFPVQMAPPRGPLDDLAQGAHD